MFDPRPLIYPNSLQKNNNFLSVETFCLLFDESAFEKGLEMGVWGSRGENRGVLNLWGKGIRKLGVPWILGARGHD